VAGPGDYYTPPQGHKSAVNALAYSWDSTRVVTTSKDGFTIVWRIDVRYQLSEDPKIVHKIPCRHQGGHYTQLAVSPKGVIAAVIGSDIDFYDMAR